MEFGGALTCMHAYRWFIEIVLPEIEKIEKRDLTVTLSICDMPRRAVTRPCSRKLQCRR